MRARQEGDGRGQPKPAPHQKTHCVLIAKGAAELVSLLDQMYHLTGESKELGWAGVCWVGGGGQHLDLRGHLFLDFKMNAIMHLDGDDQRRHRRRC